MAGKKRHSFQRKEDSSLQSVANILASGVTGELARPLRELRENLAVMVESIDRYVAEAPGPTPYPWRSLQSLRQELADAYLLSREIARLASDFHEGVAGVGDEPALVDINKEVEAALNLARHRLAGHTEVFIDLSSLPPVPAIAGQLVLAVAKLILCCAESAAAREHSAVSIKTFRESGRGARPDDPTGERVVIAVSDNGAGLPRAAKSAHAMVTPVMERLGGSFTGVSEPGQGSIFECRIPRGQEPAS
ncbi:MAG: hypothetical protein Tsb0020_31970 [Haliangiales bacterium]